MPVVDPDTSKILRQDNQGDFMNAPLMPKATAVWLIDNTSLTFEQIAVFCGLHPLVVRGIADGDVAQGIKGSNPVSAGQLAREEITRCEKDEGATLAKIVDIEVPVVLPKSKRKNYVPLLMRQEKPNAIYWLVRNHANLTDAQICRLVEGSKPAVVKIRNRTHRDIASLTPTDPVALGFCSQEDLDKEVTRAAQRKPKKAKDGDKTLQEADAPALASSAKDTDARHFLKPPPVTLPASASQASSPSAEQNNEKPATPSVEKPQDFKTDTKAEKKPKDKPAKKSEEKDDSKVENDSPFAVLASLGKGEDS